MFPLKLKKLSLNSRLFPYTQGIFFPKLKNPVNPFVGVAQKSAKKACLSNAIKLCANIWPLFKKAFGMNSKGSKNVCVYALYIDI